MSRQIAIWATAWALTCLLMVVGFQFLPKAHAAPASPNTTIGWTNDPKLFAPPTQASVTLRVGCLTNGSMTYSFDPKP